MRRKLQEDLLSLLQVEKKTVIFVTHSIEEAVYLSDRIVLLSRQPEPCLRHPGSRHRPRPPARPDRRDQRYLDTVDEIWDTLKQYLQ